MSNYSAKFNKATVAKLSNSFTPEGISVIQDEVCKQWDEVANGEVTLPITVTIPSKKIIKKCRSITLELFLSSVYSVNFEFDPEHDMEEIPTEQAPIGVWIKASEVHKYDFSYLGCADVLLRNANKRTVSEEERLNVTFDKECYLVGYLMDGEEVSLGICEDTVPLNSGDYDIMVIKLDTNK